MTDRFNALKSNPSWEFMSNDDPKCPHCGSVVSVNDNELWELYEEGEHDVECPSCQLPFRVSSQAKFSFSTDEQDDDEESS